MQVIEAGVLRPWAKNCRTPYIDQEKSAGLISQCCFVTCRMNVCILISSDLPFKFILPVSIMQKLHARNLGSTYEFCAIVCDEIQTVDVGVNDKTNPMGSLFASSQILERAVCVILVTKTHVKLVSGLSVLIHLQSNSFTQTLSFWYLELNSPFIFTPDKPHCLF